MDSRNFKKKDFVKKLQQKTGLPNNLLKKILDDLIEIIILNIKDGQLNLKNIGSFKIHQKKERIGRNPKTKETFKISSRNSIKFTPSKKININFNKTYE